MDELEFSYEQSPALCQQLTEQLQLNSKYLFYGAIGTLIGALTLLTIGMMSIIWWKRTNDHKKSQKIEALKARYQQLLSEFMAGEDENAWNNPHAIQKETFLNMDIQDLSNSLNRKIFKKELMLLQKNVSGASSERLRSLYFLLGFKTDTTKRLKKTRDIIEFSSCLNELTAMNVQEAAHLAVRYTQHADPRVQLAAMREVAHFKTNGGQLDFLDQFQGELTDWQQTQLFTALNQHDVEQLPNFERWEQHAQPTIRTFATKMNRYFTPNKFKQLKSTYS